MSGLRETLLQFKEFKKIVLQTSYSSKVVPIFYTFLLYEKDNFIIESMMWLIYYNYIYFNFKALNYDIFIFSLESEKTPLRLWDKIANSVTIID